MIDSAKFMASLFSNLVNNLSEEALRIISKYRHSDKRLKHVELNISTATVFWNTQILKMI